MTNCQSLSVSLPLSVPANVDNTDRLHSRNRQYKNYIGTTGRSLHARQGEHVHAVHARNMKNALAKHSTEHDSSNPLIFYLKILSRHKDNLTRIIAEGIYIEKADKNLLLNSRME